MYLIILLLVTLFYYYGSRNFAYWKKRGVKHDPPLLYFGNNLRQFVQKASLAMIATEVYVKHPKEKVVGFYRGLKPELIIRDPELIKRVLVTDFQHFYSRGLHPHKTVREPFLQNLFFADGDLWRLLRQRFSHAFSSGKLKAMFWHITERAEKLQTIAEQVATYDFYDMRELMVRYTTEIIGVCGFGLDMDCLNEENSQFRKLAKRIFTRTPRDAFVGALIFLFPEMFRRFTILAPEIEESMVYLVRAVMKERNYEPSGARLGQMQSMAGIAAILQKYTVEPAACSVRDPPSDPTGIVSENFVGGLPLKLRKREHFYV